MRMLIYAGKAFPLLLQLRRATVLNVIRQRLNLSIGQGLGNFVHHPVRVAAAHALRASGLNRRFLKLYDPCNDKPIH